jgi:hypothetical protein
MGAWGPGPFENDDAYDWLTGFAEQPKQVRLLGALRDVLRDRDEYLDASESSQAVAAAAVVAALCSRVKYGVPPEIKRVIKSRKAPKRQLIHKAICALDRVFACSELRDLWNETGDNKWYQHMCNLTGRLKRALARIVRPK